MTNRSVNYSRKMTSIEEVHDDSNGLHEDSNSEDEPVIDIVINNVVCSFSVRCHLDLKRIALEGFNVEFKKECGMLTMKLRNPYTTASMWSSGKITCTGATSTENAKIAARKFARLLQKMGFKTRLSKFKVVNVLGTCTMPFGIYITKFSENHPKAASYEPELHPGVTYKVKDFKATLKIFSTGSITITAPTIENIQLAVQQIFPLVYEFKKVITEQDLNGVNMSVASKKRQIAQLKRMQQHKLREYNEEYKMSEEESENNESYASDDGYD